MQICPCRDCEDRKFLCHSSCELYQKWKDDYETVRDGLAEERGGRLRLSFALAADEAHLPKLASFAAGRMLREDAALSVDGGRRPFLWQGAPASAGAPALARLFETFMDSCDWWRSRVEEPRGEEERVQGELYMIRP